MRSQRSAAQLGCSLCFISIAVTSKDIKPSDTPVDGLSQYYKNIDGLSQYYKNNKRVV